MLADEPVSVHRCFATVRCCCDRLPIPEVSHVSCRKYSWHVRLGFLVCDDVAFGVEIYLSFKDRSVWFVADRHEHPVCLEKLFLSSLEVLAPDPRNVAISQNFFHDRIPDEAYLRVL